MERKESLSSSILTMTPLSSCLYVFLSSWEVYTLCVTSRQTRRLYLPFMSFFDAHSFDVSKTSDVLRLDECIAKQIAKGAVKIQNDFLVPSPVDFSKLGNVTKLNWNGDIKVAIQHADYPSKLLTLDVAFALNTISHANTSFPLRALPPNLTFLSTNATELFDMQSTSLTSLQLTFGSTNFALDAALCPNLSHLEFIFAGDGLKANIKSGVLRTFTQLQSLYFVSDCSELPETLCGNLPHSLRKLELSRANPLYPTIGIISTDMLPPNLIELAVNFVVARECYYALPRTLEKFSCATFAMSHFTAGIFPASLTSCTFHCSDFLCVTDSRILPVGLRHLQFNGAFKTQEVADEYHLLTSLMYLNVQKSFEFELYVPPMLQKLAISSDMLYALPSTRMLNSVLNLKITGASFRSANLGLDRFPMTTSLDLPKLHCRRRYEPSPRPLITSLRVDERPDFAQFMTPNLQKLVVVVLYDGEALCAKRLPNTITTVEIDCGWPRWQPTLCFQNITSFVKNAVVPLPRLATLVLHGEVLQGEFAEEFIAQICKFISARGLHFYAAVNKKKHTHSIHLIK